MKHTPFFYAALTAATFTIHAQQPMIRIDNDDIGGVVTSKAGSEAGVWVIAETTGLPTRYIKIVVTDDQGRYVLPDLPKATYDVWVRGLRAGRFAEAAGRVRKAVESHSRGQRRPARGRSVLPGELLVFLLKVPDASDSPGTGPNGNGISESMKTQAQHLELLHTG